jgi:hypothetical protein
MAVTTEYRTGVASVLWAGRALENAVESGDDVETQAAIAELLRAAEARESAGTVPGFTPSFSATDEALPQSGEEAIAQVLAELDVGHALLTAGSVAGEGTAPAPAQLTDALDTHSTTWRRRRRSSRVPPDRRRSDSGQRRSRPRGHRSTSSAARCRRRST